ncbi:aryl-alcohol dehydrogenase-like predicted oxidoreductase [Chryseobacterium ginsenosidimutans]|uniref:aldo/keto reductase n=1 Tax=Chryseobacterium ginsenosidimutans TaxID=687846 RepID=UPI0021691396|nr:aldo/keto reductase [Chryseobacterium ginsenosidimutans]MCS3869278.1 aryl-alcohol dehydrogenase-like predicted oxidoreductase [Chryseobacterium ginsenosidimutans]
MEYRKLGDTHLELSAITYGSFAIGGTMWGGTEENEAQNAIRASIDHGVTTIDTAPFYGLGFSEELIGRTIKDMDRSKIQILTKFGMVWDGSNEGKGDYMWDQEDNGNVYPLYKYASKANVIKETEESLKRLKTDYIDLLQLHWPDSTTPIDETMEALQRLIEQGKIRAAGVSNYDKNQMLEAQKTIKLASNQLPYSMLNRLIEKDIVPAAIENNIGLIAYSPLERGLLSGKYFKGEHLKSDDHRNGYFGQFDPEKVKNFLSKIEPLANDKNATPAQLVLRWTTLQPGISVVLAGARNSEQAISNAKSIDITLTQEELLFINKELEIFS